MPVASIRPVIGPTDTRAYACPWKVDIGSLDLKDSNVFFLGINGRAFTSHYFNVTNVSLDDNDSALRGDPNSDRQFIKWAAIAIGICWAILLILWFCGKMPTNSGPSPEEVYEMSRR